MRGAPGRPRIKATEREIAVVRESLHFERRSKRLMNRYAVISRSDRERVSVWAVLMKIRLCTRVPSHEDRRWYRFRISKRLLEQCLRGRERLPVAWQREED